MTSDKRGESYALACRQPVLGSRALLPLVCEFSFDVTTQSSDDSRCLLDLRLQPSKGLVVNQLGIECGIEQ
ncbi:MAG: hypothetical protein QOJ59_2813 [Thermomicrobiales bacterium]|nr:hypothetical protein [Thermomicrobiales bacterium]